MAATVHPLCISHTSLRGSDAHDDHHVMVFLPSDWLPYLECLDIEPIWRVHGDRGSTTRRAYASWSCACGGVPRTLWLGLTPLLRVMHANHPPDAHPESDSWGAPIWFIAGGQAVRRVVSIHQSKWLALQCQVDTPLDEDEQDARLLELDRAVRDGGPQPWLHGRHELINAGQRLDVLLAPLAVPGVCRAHASLSPFGAFTLT